MKVFYSFKDNVVKDNMVIFKGHNYYDQQHFSLLEHNQSCADITDFVVGKLSHGTLKHLKISGNLHVDFGNVLLRACLVHDDQSLISLRIEYNDLNDYDAKNILDN